MNAKVKFYLTLVMGMLTISILFSVYSVDTQTNTQIAQRQCKGKVSAYEFNNENYIRYQLEDTERIVEAKARGDIEKEINQMVDRWRLYTVLFQAGGNSLLILAEMIAIAPPSQMSTVQILERLRDIFRKKTNVGPLDYFSKWLTYTHNNEELPIPENEYWLAIPSRLITHIGPTLRNSYYNNPGSIAYLMCYENQSDTNIPVETPPIVSIATPNVPPLPPINPSYRIANVSYLNTVIPRQTFRPEITICVNIGTLSGSRGDMLRNTDGNLFGAYPHIAVSGLVNQGQCYKFVLYQNSPIVAPSTEGTYNTRYQLWANGRLFQVLK